MYADFAQIYDVLMADFDYDAYADDLLGLLPQDYDIQSICEAGCGTGKVTQALLKKTQAHITAFDLSVDMLAHAAQRLGMDDKVTLLQGDLRTFESFHKYDLYISTLDTLNYMLEDEDLMAAFKVARALVKEGAFFIFDINTPYKLQVIQGSEIYVHEESDIFYVWTNSLDEIANRVDYQIDFFIKEADGRYQRLVEVQTERWYEKNYIMKCLELSGFEVVKWLALPAPDEPDGPPARWLVSARAR